MERVLASLGLPPQSRTAMITGWLPNVTRYKNIVSITTMAEVSRMGLW